MAFLQRKLANGTLVNLPSPVDAEEGEQVIWSENTGRSSKEGEMIGDAIADKRTRKISWGVLTQTEMDRIKTYLPKGFIDIVYNGVAMKVYRGDIEAKILGVYSGVTYYQNASVELIEK